MLSLKGLTWVGPKKDCPYHVSRKDRRNNSMLRCYRAQRAATWRDSITKSFANEHIYFLRSETDFDLLLTKNAICNILSKETHHDSTVVIFHHGIALYGNSVGSRKRARHALKNYGSSIFSK